VVGLNLIRVVGVGVGVGIWASTDAGKAWDKEKIAGAVEAIRIARHSTERPRRARALEWVDPGAFALQRWYGAASDLAPRPQEAPVRRRRASPNIRVALSQQAGFAGLAVDRIA